MITKILRHAAIFGLAVIFTHSLCAQITAGTLGRRYAGVFVFTEDIRAAGIDNGTGATFVLNLPVHPNLDFSLSGLSERISTNDYRETQFLATLTAHREMSGVTPFFDVTLGNVRQSSEVNGIDYREDQNLYALGGGIEAPVADATALFGRIAFNQYFKNRLGHYWTYTVGLNHWFTPKVGCVGSVTWRGNDSTYLGFGLNLRF
jgi:hypothetical protein